MGLMSASAATGLLVFLPLLAMLAEHGGWKPVAIAVSVATAALLPLVYFLVPERPSSIGLFALRRRRAGAGRGRHGQFPRGDAVDAASRPPRRASSGCCSPPSSSAASPPTAWSARI